MKPYIIVCVVAVILVAQFGIAVGVNEWLAAEAGPPGPRG